MTRFLLTALCLLVAGCKSGLPEAGQMTVAEQQRAAARIESRLESASRSRADQSRDAARQPAAVLGYLGVSPGMTVIDLVAGDGYYAEVLAHSVGPEGRVYARNPARILAMADGVNEKAMRARLAGGRLQNVVRWDREVSALGLGPNTVDLALLNLAFHELHHRRDGSAARLLEATYEVLKPGGVLGVIDHVGLPGGNNAPLYRVVPVMIERVAGAAGFQFGGRSERLANFQDDHRRSAFDEALGGRPDRVLYRFVKPATDPS